MDILATQARHAVQIEACNKLLNDREKKTIKAFCLKIIFESSVSISSRKVTNLEDICKQIETEFHQRVGAFKAILDKSNEEESGLNVRNPWRQWFSNLCFMRTSPL